MDRWVVLCCVLLCIHFIGFPVNHEDINIGFMNTLLLDQKKLPL